MNRNVDAELGLSLPCTVASWMRAIISLNSSLCSVICQMLCMVSSLVVGLSAAPKVES